MNTFIIEDSQNALRNTVTVFNTGGIAYNAVLDVKFSDEAALEPLTLREVKDWLKISPDIDDEDNLITSLITAARMVCENYANISFITRTVTAKIHNGLGNFNLPYGPVIGNITSVTDNDGNAITDFKLTDSYKSDATVIYDAGYEELPDNLKTALKSQIAYLYSQRGDEPLTNTLSVPTQIILKQIRNV